MRRAPWGHAAWSLRETAAQSKTKVMKIETAQSPDPNRFAFEAIAERYAEHWHLHPPERVLLQRLRGRWQDTDMLDLGVGAGRTAFTFAAIARSYVGIDYSPRMIEISRRVIGEDDQVRFEVCDARDLSRFRTRSFHVVMYSFNGIDCVGHDDRLTVLHQIRRVIADDGILFFSSHSLEVLPLRARFRRPTLRSPARSMYYSLRAVDEAARLWRANRHLDLDAARRRGWVVHRDEASMGRANTYYGSLPTALKQIADSGFAATEVLDTDGVPINPQGAGDASLWRSYFCSPLN